MEKYFVLKFLTTLLVVSITNHRTVEAEMDQVDFLWKEQNWQGMTWFTGVHGHKGLLEKSNLSAVKDDYERVDKLKIFPLLMGCGYGQKLIDFLYLTTYAVTDLANRLSGSYFNRWQQLEVFVQKATYGIFKLLLAFEQITSLDPGLKVDQIPFHYPLLAINDFLNKTSNLRISLTIKEAKLFNQELMDLITSLGCIMDVTCVPKHTIVKQEDLTSAYENLTDEYKTQMKITILPDFYLYKMDTSIEFITEQLIYIGYNYLPQKNTMTYAVPASSADAYS